MGGFFGCPIIFGAPIYVEFSLDRQFIVVTDAQFLF